jgi:hypothetical protein
LGKTIAAPGDSICDESLRLLAPMVYQAINQYRTTNGAGFLSDHRDQKNGDYALDAPTAGKL